MSSFNLNKDFIYLFLTDLVTFSIIFSIFFQFTTYITKKSAEVMQGKTPEELQAMISNSTPEQILPFMKGLQSFVILSLVSVVLLAVFSFLLYSLSRSLIWNHLNHKKTTKKTYWRWNLLNFFLVIPLVLFGLLFFVVRVTVSLLTNFIYSLMPVFVALHSTLAENLKLIINAAVGFYLVLFFMITVFLIYHDFSKKYRVWDSVSAGFKTVKKNFKKLNFLVLFTTIVALVLTLIAIMVKKTIFSPTILNLFNLTLTSILLAWMRLYLLRTVKLESR